MSFLNTRSMTTTYAIDEHWTIQLFTCTRQFNAPGLIYNIVARCDGKVVASTAGRSEKRVRATGNEMWARIRNGARTTQEIFGEA